VANVENSRRKITSFAGYLIKECAKKPQKGGTRYLFRGLRNMRKIYRPSRNSENNRRVFEFDLKIFEFCPKIANFPSAGRE
jgi:hypothetical protein